MSAEQSSKENIEIKSSNNNKTKNQKVDIVEEVNDQRLPSICIPRLDLWVTNDYIEKIMNEVLLPQDTYLTTCIERIDILTRQNEKGEDFKRAFIHFIPWNSFESSSSKKMRQKLLSGETVKIMHNHPCYWKCSASRVPRPEWQEHSPPAEKQRVKAFIMDDNENINNEKDNNIAADSSKVNKNQKQNQLNIKKKVQKINNPSNLKQNSEHKPKWLGEPILDTFSSVETVIGEPANVVVSNNKKEQTNIKKMQKKKFPHPEGTAPPGKVWDCMLGTWININRKL